MKPGVLVLLIVALLHPGCDSVGRMDPNSAGSGSIAGTIRNAVTNAPVAGVRVSAGGVQSTTNDRGEYQLLNVPVGSYSLVASRTDYDDYLDTVRISESKQENFDISLVPLKPIVTLGGTVTAISTGLPVEGASVWVDDQETYTNGSGEFRLDNILSGTRHLRVYKSGFDLYEDSVYVDASLPVIDVGLLPATPGNVIGLEFIRIRAGAFRMGSDGGSADEQPVHVVNLSYDFYLGKYEVTQEQYEYVTGTKPSYFPGNGSRPVEQVSWFDAIQFANGLSALEGLPPCYRDDGSVNGGDPYVCDGYRLPTEAEWEYASRAGTTTEYSFGNSVDNLDSYAWYEDNAGGNSQPVGRKEPNEWGLYDMHGNVWEWVHDVYDAYAGSPQSNPFGPSSGSNRVRRGGSWYNTAKSLRLAVRFGTASATRGSSIGFRLARTAKDPG